MSNASNRFVGEHPCNGSWQPTVIGESSMILDHVVGSGDCDHLGHMNIRRYAEIAEAATPSTLAAVGLDAMVLADAAVVPTTVDVYTRHYREQHVGSTLRLTAGCLEAGDDGFTMYAELHNVDSGDLAATFVQRNRLLTVIDRKPAAPPVDAIRAAWNNR